MTTQFDYTYDDYFYLTDSDNNHSLFIAHDSFYNISLYAGQKVKVAGKFIFDEKDFRYKITLSDKTHGIWLLEDDFLSLPKCPFYFCSDCPSYTKCHS